MRIILTHEQADFDALASLLGAGLLDEAAIPVLPSRMNRNVCAFINLYGAELPFIERRDLPQEPIETVTLVDTQAMASVRGVGTHTPVHVIDHHPLRTALPPNWTLTLLETGANTTLFVESLREKDAQLSTVQATLLLMGIYEDTGSLTYTRTTSRDIRAAAFLLDEGASLRIAIDFLNHPLSLAQQEIYDTLRSQAVSIPVHGHSITIACGDARELDEELSTIAHKLRDLLDPDGLFLLVKTHSGIQMIARSTTDSIDVAEITARFGGGGHSRAAAGLIRGQNLEKVRQDLIRILPQYVHPAVTVAQIMSRGPQVLGPSVLAEEAAARMQRYGYEGYPVVKDGRVVGLLTRRAVDRSLSHKLNLPAASLMDAGEVTIQPQDSIDYLQRLMTESGWGQVPVVHPETGEIIGIVTRTDLLKTLNHEARYSGFQNLGSRLEKALPPERLVLLKAIAAAAREQHAALYLVGGFVRDLILDRPSLDFDLVVEGDAISLAHILASHYGGHVTSHSRFGTAKWFPARRTQASSVNPRDSADKPYPPLEVNRLPRSIDLISARTEFYTHPTALPTVERGSIKLDLHRRDFTINTLALRLDGHHYGELHDYWGGLNDLRLNLVRCLHSLSFVDDPTRMLRAVRFEQRFDFKIEERTLQLLIEARPLIERVSGDRIRHELDHILDEQRSTQMLARLADLGLLKSIHPDLSWGNWIQSKIEALQGLCPQSFWGFEKYGSGVKPSQSGADRENQPVGVKIPLKSALAYALWLVRLSPNRAGNVLTRLKIPRGLTEEILAACRLWLLMPSLRSEPVSIKTTRLDEYPPLAVYTVYLASSDPSQREMLITYASRWRMLVPSITGEDLIARGLRPGPHFRTILGELRSAWLDGKINSPDEEANLLEKLINSSRGTGSNSLN
jgi:tRNA nucleotidyltransferase (CCA-adding enzyme)